MKNSFKLLLILSIAFLNACSGDDNQEETNVTSTNGFHFSGNFFMTDNISIEERNLSNTTLKQYNVNLTDYNFENAVGIDISNTSRVTIILQAADLSPKTITTGLTNYMVNASSDTTSILLNNDSDISLDSFEIKINRSSSSSIEMEYRFIRKDGQIINGQYNGSYSLRDR